MEHFYEEQLDRKKTKEDYQFELENEGFAEGITVDDKFFERTYGTDWLIPDLIERNKVWKEIIKTNPEITPYSLRHRYAHQCHKGSTIPISVKDAAAAMGHSVETHNSFYGSYTTELSLEKAFERHLKNRIEV